MNLGVLAGLIGGTALLLVGAEALVRGAARVAAAARISPLVVGLTIVAFGTSAPELAVSAGAALSGSGEVAVGNALGSNVFNVLLIIGLSALFGGLVVHLRVVRLDVPLLLGVTALTWLAAADGRLGPAEGAVGLAGIVVYSAWSSISSRREPAPVVEEYAEAFAVEPREARRGWLAAAAAIPLGLAGLVVGAQILVGAAAELATSLGVSQLVIGLTVVAAGTSLPELATSMIAALRGERDIAVGNVVGSNLFNLLAVLGTAAVLAPGGLEVPEAVLRLDLPVTLLVVLVALPALATGLVVERWEGVLLVLCYAGYVAVVVMTGTGSPGAPAARAALFAGLVAVSTVLLAVGLARRTRLLQSLRR